MVAGQLFQPPQRLVRSRPGSVQIHLEIKITKVTKKITFLTLQTFFYPGTSAQLIIDSLAYMQYFLAWSSCTLYSVQISHVLTHVFPARLIISLVQTSGISISMINIRRLRWALLIFENCFAECAYAYAYVASVNQADVASVNQALEVFFTFLNELFATVQVKSTQVTITFIKSFLVKLYILFSQKSLSSRKLTRQTRTVPPYIDTTKLSSSLQTEKGLGPRDRGIVILMH